MFNAAKAEASKMCKKIWDCWSSSFIT